MSSFFAQFRSTKPRDEWVENASTEQVLNDLTTAFAEGNREQLAAAFSSEELSTFHNVFKSISSNDSSEYSLMPISSQSSVQLTRPLDLTAEEISSFLTKANPSLSQPQTLYPVIQYFSSVPFPTQTQSGPVTAPALLRAIALLTPRSQKLLGSPQSSFSMKNGRQVIQRGRSDRDRQALLFRSLADSSSGYAASKDGAIDDVLDVLVALQPHPNPSRAYLKRDELRPIAERLAIPQPHLAELKVPREKVVGLVEAIKSLQPDSAATDITEESGEIDYETFAKIIADRPQFFEGFEALFQPFLKP